MPTFRGVFVGVDRFVSDDIDSLASARRDALALHAVFSDTFGGKTTLLVDEDATHARVSAALEELTAAEPEDFVVFTFSGHGAASHHIVAHDTDPRDLPGTGISLEFLTQLFKRIPARQVVCILDCCFSGGMGAKVLITDTRARDLESVGILLEQLSGEGRLILTASGANEAAFESGRFGHGLFTYFMIEGMLGAPEVLTDGEIPLLKLIDYVTRSVIASSGEIGIAQHPTMRGSLEGQVRWPIFKRATAYSKAFPGWNVDRATEDVASLEALGFPSRLIAAWRQDITSLNELQLDAINRHGVLAGKNLLVSAPTSSGKTMIGELAAIRGALTGRRTVFLLPMRALVNDKYERFTRVYGALGIRTIRATGEIADDVPQLMRGRYDICLMTNEKFASLALAVPGLLRQIGLLVVDEAQMITDANRGLTLEFLLTLIRVRGRLHAAPQMILLSAVIGGANGLDTWLDASLLMSTKRPVPLDEGVVCPNGDYRYIDSDRREQRESRFIRRLGLKNSAQDWVIPLLQRLVSENEQVIVFREKRGDAQGTASYLARELGLPAAESALKQLPSGDPSAASADLRAALGGGVAFHMADLDREERRVVEEEFRRKDSGVRAIAATTTLAMGINTPATSVVIAGLEHPGPQPAPYSVAEYKNMVGRAGRLGYAPKGRSFTIAETPQAEEYIWRRYVQGSPEAIDSHFPIERGDPASIMTRILAAAEAGGMSADEIIDFVALSFGAHQRAQRDLAWTVDRARFDRALGQLLTADLARQDEGGHISLTALGRVAGETGTQVTSVLQLATMIRRMPAAALTDVALLAATQVTLELDEQYVPINRKSIHKEAHVWLAEVQSQGIHEAVYNGLQSWTTDQWAPPMRAKRAVACLLWMSDWPFSQIERSLAQFGGFNPGGPARSVISRTLDIISTTIRVAEIVHQDSTLSTRTRGLMVRLEIGLPAAVVPLALHVGNALSRGDYLALAKRGLVDVPSAQTADADVLRACLGGSESRLDALRAALAKPVVAVAPVPPIPDYDDRGRPAQP